jgi:anti-sigma regulatory factor (Ser/Thr protein kinase)
VAPGLNADEPLEPVGIRITTLPEARRAEDSARRLAASIGFSTQDCEEIGLVVNELASNLIRHAGGGTLRLTVNAAEGRTGIQIESEDRGPGIPDFDRAVTDGYSSAGGLGAGLGAVNRLMDELELRPLPAGGAHLVCQRWLRPRAAMAAARWLEVGAATRAYRYQRESGDAFIVRQWNGSALTGVIDGLGHGQFAQRAAQAARQYVERHFDSSLEDLFRGTGRACRATRGVVMALARFDFARQTLAVATVGNIEVRIVGATTPVNLIVRRGIVGLNAPQPVPTVWPWTTDSLLVMHSDGVSSRWGWKDLCDLGQESSGTIAQRLLLAHGSIEDDATVLVVRSARP